MSQRLFLIVDYVVFGVVVTVFAVLPFVAVVAAAEFDVVISAVAAVFFHFVVVLVLFVHAVVVSDFENDDGDFAVPCRLHLTVLIGLMQLSGFPSEILLNRSLAKAASVENEYFPEKFLSFHVFLF